jgi:hypothetical protein
MGQGWHYGARRTRAQKVSPRPTLKIRVKKSVSATSVVRAHATDTKNPQARKRLQKNASGEAGKLIQVAPIRSRTYLDQQRNGNLLDAFHLFFYQF